MLQHITYDLMLQFEHSDKFDSIFKFIVLSLNANDSIQGHAFIFIYYFVKS